MRVNVLRRGLCTTCEHDARCSYPRHPDRPVLCCEEFRAEPPGPAPARRAAAAARPRPEPSPGTDDTARYKGLCANCENLAVCNFPKHDGGVWHCEEYR